MEEEDRAIAEAAESEVRESVAVSSRLGEIMIPRFARSCEIRA